MQKLITIFLVSLLAFNTNCIEFVDECPVILGNTTVTELPKGDNIYLFKGCDWAGFGQCGSTLQSPIDIDGQADPNCQNLLTDGYSFNFEMNTKEVQLKFEEGNGQLKTVWPQDDGEATTIFHYKTGEVDHIFLLQEISVHTGSEHTINTGKYQAEVQFTFKLAENQSQEGLSTPGGTVRDLVILSLLFEMNNGGLGNFFIPNNWDVKKAISGEAFPFKLSDAFQGINLNSLNYFHYFGSQTLPECTENVNWFVIHDSFQIGDNELFPLSQLFSDPKKFPTGNVRALQNPNGRKIYQGNCKIPLAAQGSL